MFRQHNTIITVFLFLIVSSCSSKNNNSAISINQSKNDTIVSLTVEQIKNAGIVTGYPEEKNMPTVIKLNGVVDVPPQNLLSVSFPMGGYLKSSNLLPGSAVFKGQVIAVMEDQSYVQLQQDYLIAKAKMEYVSVDVQRQKELSDADAASKKSYQQVASDFKSQQIIIKSFEEKLKVIGINPEKLNVSTISRTVNVRSPINGFVTKVNVNVGKYVNPTDVMFELVNPDDIHAAMTVFEKDISLFSKGMKGYVALANEQQKNEEVEVVLITKNISDNRTGIMHCHFLHPNHQLLPGMFLTGNFIVKNKKLIVVPEDAVVRYAGKQYVFIAKGDSKFYMTEVEVEAEANHIVAIKSLLNINWLQQNLVTKNAYVLLGKLKNKVEE